MVKVYLILLALLVSACSAPPAVPVSPTPQIIKTFYPPALRSYAQVLNDCATASPLIAVFHNENPKPEEKLLVADLVLSLGAPPKELDGYYAIQVGLEEIVVIVNSDNNIISITQDELRALFSGHTTQWEVHNTSQNFVQVWVYPTGDAIREAFNIVILGGGMISPQARIAPDPQAMLEAVAVHDGAIGYLLKSWVVEKDLDLTAGIRIVQLDAALAEALQQPILALTKIEPQGALRSLLSCLQTQGE